MKIRLYLYKLFLQKSASVLFGLILIFWIIKSLRLLDTIVSKGMNLFDFLQLSLYLIPYITYNILPFACVIGLMIVHRLLTADNELLVLRLSGFSKFRLMQPFAEICLSAMLLGLVISIYLIPLSYNKFYQIILRYQSYYLATFIEDKTFNSDINGITFYIENKADSMFEGVFINDHRIPGKNITIFAERGQLANSQSGLNFILHDGIQFEDNLKNNTSQTLKFATYNLVIDYSKAIDRIKNIQHQELTVRQLLNTPKTVDNYNELRAEGYQRLMWPSMTLIAPIILIAFLLNEKYQRRINYKKISYGLSLSFLFILFNAYASSAANNNWHIMLYVLGANTATLTLATYFVIRE